MWPVLLLLLLLGQRRRPEPDPRPQPRPEPSPWPEPGPAPWPEPEPPPGLEPAWVLPGNAQTVQASSFGQGRPFGSSDPTKHHAGIDVDAELLDPVVMPEAGTVVRTGGWVGAMAKSVTVQLDTGPQIVFGALHPDHLPTRGARLERGELVGRIGRYPNGGTMLHFELWAPGTWSGHARPSGPWPWGEAQPAALLDPTNYLRSMVG